MSNGKTVKSWARNFTPRPSRTSCRMEGGNQVKRLFIIFVVLLSISAHAGEKWYVGGTLHNASCAQWHQGSYADRLATCADYLACTEPWRSTMKKWGVDSVKGEAMELESFITGACSNGQFADMKTLMAMGVVWMQHSK